LLLGWPLAALAATEVVDSTDPRYVDGPSKAFEESEKARLERLARIAKGRVKFDSLVKTVEKAGTAVEFEDAADQLSLYLLGAGIPEGVNVKETVNRVRLAYNEFDNPCPATVKNCANPRSARAEGAYSSFLGVLRSTAPKNAGVGSGSNGALLGF